MDVLYRSERSLTAARIGLALAASLLLALAVPARARDRDVLLRFLPPENSGVTGYTVYAKDIGTELEELFEVGFVAPDPDGVGQTTVVLDAACSYLVAMTASNDFGESARSNSIHIAAEIPICDPAFCDDGNPCTHDSCDVASCYSTSLPDGTLCDDGYVDTVDDRCVQGVCEGMLLACRSDFDCDDEDVCNGLEVCEGGTVCLEGIPLDCGEPTACTVPRCDAVAGCFTEFRPDATPCDDGLTETHDDACWDGVCQGVPTVSEPTLLVEALSPAVVSPGRQTITVRGQGFARGATLRFLNGQGRSPKVRSLRLVDDRALEATVDVSRKGPRRSRVWDALVTLPDGTAAWLPGALRIDP